ncbi:MAG: ribonuclease III [Spirochaetaceae bacterium]|nr:ribonuclease III [Spirochaetaceae bacterium]
MREIKEDKNISRKIILKKFQEKISVSFKSFDLLNQAFLHRSVANENLQCKGNNERLEFLGDAVLGMAVATYLYESLENLQEGDLAQIKSVVVSEAILSKIALKIGIDECLVLGKGEEMSGGRQKKALLADAMEAVIGAYYLDSGYDKAEKLVLSLIIPEILEVIEKKHTKDAKTQLQEFVQKKYKICPKYELCSISGPDHDKTFEVLVRIGNKVFGPEKGKNKKSAEQSVASLALKELEK